MNTVGERLFVARKAAGLSQRDLAARVGVSATAISKYERDLDMPGSKVLLALARALERRVDYFLRSREVEISCPEFRKRARLGEKAKQAVLAAAREESERYLEARELCPSADPIPGAPFFPGVEVRSLEDAEIAAERVREGWRLGLDPIESLVDVLEDNGIHVLVIPASVDFDAFTCLVNGYLPLIAVRGGVPGDRQRLSMAHELGHLVMRCSTEIDPEKAAYRFAGAFLVPREAALRELGNSRSAFEVPDELILLKEKYGISMQAWIMRARDLGIIKTETAAAYFRQFRKRRWHSQEPGPQYPAEEPKKLRQMVLRALAEQVLTESRAAELLGEPVRIWALGDENVSAA
ncbi:MAG: helix-turn-helix domain-containing protein [Thermoleophilia bacterium]